MDGVGNQKAAHLVTAEIVNRCVPVPVQAFASVGMLIEGGAVETIQPVSIGWEMTRHPVQDDTDSGLVRPVDETGKAVRRTKPRCRREQTQRLVAPGTPEGMFRNWHELNMREAEIDYVGQ